MTAFNALKVPTIDRLVIGLEGPDTVHLGGTITMRDPAAEVGVFFKEVHRLALANRLPEVTVNVSKLTFVNSSSIRLFVDWVTWVRAETESSRYKLRFLTSRRITWQSTSFSAIVSLAPEVVVAQAID